MAVRGQTALPIGVRLRESFAALPRGERSVARTLLNAYPIAGLGTLAELAERAGVSAPTVLRLLTRLGFDGYSDFQRALHVEGAERLAGVFDGYAGQPSSHDSAAAASLAAAAAALEAPIATVSHQELETAVELLAGPRSTVHCIGGSYSQALALFLQVHLSVLRPNVVFHAYGSSQAAVALAQPGTRDILAVYDFRRYSEWSIALARNVAAGGGRVVLLTDPWLSPVAPLASAVLVARTDTASPFDSLVSAAALTEALIAALSVRLDAAARPRADAIERLSAACSGREEGA